MCLILCLFVVVQYNDPDFYFWMPVYALPALWTGLAALRPALLKHTTLFAMLVLSLCVAIAGTVWFWPSETGFWQKEVWWESEAAREGLGMLIVTVALVVAASSAMSVRRRLS